MKGDLAGWVTLRSLCRDRGVDRRRMLRHLKSLDASAPGTFLRRAAATTTGARAPWLVNVRRLDLHAGPSRQAVDATIERFQMTVSDLQDSVAHLSLRVQSLEVRSRTGRDGTTLAASGRSPAR